MPTTTTQAENLDQVLDKIHVQELDREDTPRRIAGHLVKLSQPKLTHYHTDLFHDYETIKRLFQDSEQLWFNICEFGITWMVRKTGTWLQLNTSTDPRGEKFVKTVNNGERHDIYSIKFEAVGSYGGTDIIFERWN